MIKLLAGLGNPGPEYADTRHNAGFWLVDRVAAQGGATLRREARFDGLAARVQHRGQALWLLEPQSFMNRSGKGVRALAAFHQIAPEEILVVHDELDLAPGAAKLKFGGGTGGHNGLKDIVAHLGTQNFWRLRLGVGHPRDLLPPEAPKNAHQDVAAYVLKPPRREDQPRIDDAIDRAIAVLDLMMAGDSEKAMLRLHSAS